jgi:membrane dipeptidase
MKIVVDAHEDIAWNMLTFGRDILRPVAETRALEAGTEVLTHVSQALLGYPEWIRGGVAVVFATLFAAPQRRQAGPWETLCYADAEQAHRLYRLQLDAYQRLLEAHADQLRLIRSRADLEQVLATWEGEAPAAPVVGWVLLMEGGDGVREPAELPEWYELGVRALGPAWAGTRYSGGTREPGPLTLDGRALLEAMADLEMSLDLSHMPEEAALESLDRYPGTILVSHGNARALLDGSPIPERHLTDLVIRRVAERDGVIGIVPYNRFLKGGWVVEDGRAVVPLDRVVQQIDYICQRVGDAGHVGLGSDFDGGWGLAMTPEGLDSVADLRLIGDALAVRGYSQEDVGGVLSGNWLKLLRRSLPEP